MSNKYDFYDLDKVEELAGRPETIEIDGYYWDPTDLPPKDYLDEQVPLQFKNIGKWMRSKMNGLQTRETMARLAEMVGINTHRAIDVAERTQIRQDAVEDFNNQVIQEMTDKDVISAPEIIEARKGKVKLSERLDDDFGAITSELSQAVLDLLGVSADVVTLNRYVSENWVDIRHFGAVADANFYNSKNDTWYKNGTYTGYLGSNPTGLDVANLYYNPDDYNYYSGATFNEPATDNASAIQAAIDFASQSSTVKRIYTPNGRFLINGRLTILKSNLMFTGNGPTSEWIAGSGVDQYLIYSHNDDRDYNNKNLTNVVFQDFAINGNGKVLTGIWMRQMTRGCVIERMKVHNFALKQIQIEYSWSFSLINNVINGVTTHSGTTWVYQGIGLMLGETNTVNIPTIIGNTFQFLAEGLSWRYGLGGVMTGNDFENCETYWLRAIAVKGASLTGNYFEDLRTGTNGVQLGSQATNDFGDSIVFSGNIFEVRKPGQVSILVRHLSNCQITNNRMTGDDGFDISIQSSPVLLSDKVYANTISYRTGKIYNLAGISAADNTLIEVKKGTV